MKTNLTKKQIKKIQNGKLAIYKDIDTAEAREYLLNVLDWLFPNDDDKRKQKIIAVERGFNFYAFDDSIWCHCPEVEISSIPLSQIMYTYNPKQFKPISMPCTEEQWSNDLKPVVDVFGVKENVSGSFITYNHLSNSGANNGRAYIGNYKGSNIADEEKINHYSPTEFLEACGIVRVDKELEQTYTITTDQIKTARTNPETLEELFPKVFEKPVVEVGKWWKCTAADGDVLFVFIEKIETDCIYGYGFNCVNEFRESKTMFFYNNIENTLFELATLSDLQPLFEAEFNKRYKEGDLLECVFNRNDKKLFINETIHYYFNSNGFEAVVNGICLFRFGNFAKVIKSAELIKAEEELEEAKNKVERLTNK